MTEMTITDLTKVVSESGVEPQTADSLKTAFLPFFQQMAAWQEKAHAISVTSAEQTGEMKLARTVRLELRSIRIAADRTREALKKDALAYGSAVQSVYNAIRDVIQPLEEHLEKQEKFAEIQEAHERAERKYIRETELAPFAAFAPAWLRLEDLDEESFGRLLNAAKAAMEAKKAADAKAEQERVERELAEAAERERVRLENERLRAEAAEIAAKALETLAAERAERERLESEMRQLESEARQKAAAEAAAKRAAEQAEAAAKAAPDRERLAAYAEQIKALSKAAPTVEGKDALRSLAQAQAHLLDAADKLFL